MLATNIAKVVLADVKNNITKSALVEVWTAVAFSERKMGRAL